MAHILDPHLLCTDNQYRAARAELDELIGAEFARWLGTALAAHDERALVEYRDRAPSAARAHPTDEHLLPLFVAFGAAGRDARLERVVDGFENGALARDSFLFGG